MQSLRYNDEVVLLDGQLLGSDGDVDRLGFGQRDGTFRDQLRFESRDGQAGIPNVLVHQDSLGLLQDNECEEVIARAVIALFGGRFGAIIGGTGGVGGVDANGRVVQENVPSVPPYTI